MLPPRDAWNAQLENYKKCVQTLFLTLQWTGEEIVPRTFLQLDLGRAVTRPDEAMRRLFFNDTVDGTKKRRPRQSLARAHGRVRDDPVRGTALTTMLKTNPGGSRGAARPSPAAPPLTLLKS